MSPSRYARRVLATTALFALVVTGCLQEHTIGARDGDGGAAGGDDAGNGGGDDAAARGGDDAAPARDSSPADDASADRVEPGDAGAGCAPSKYGEHRVACDLHPTTSVVATDPNNVYFVDWADNAFHLYRLARAGGGVTPLYQGQTTCPYAYSARLSDRYPLVAGHFYVEAPATAGGAQLIEVDASTGATRVIIPSRVHPWNWVYRDGAVYYHQADDGLGAAPGSDHGIWRVDLTTLAATQVAPQGGFVWGIGGGAIFYTPFFDDYDPNANPLVYRAPLAGGGATVVPGLRGATHGCQAYTMIAVGDDGSVYGTAPMTAGRIIATRPDGTTETVSTVDLVWGLEYSAGALFVYNASQVLRVGTSAGSNAELLFGPASFKDDYSEPTAPIVDGHTAFFSFYESPTAHPTVGLIATVPLP